jgi:hypothetical protein
MSPEYRLLCLLLVCLTAAAAWPAPARAGGFDLGGPCVSRSDPEDSYLELPRARERGDWPRVIALETESVRRMCANPYRWYQLADAYLRAGDRARAAAVLKEVYDRGFEVKPSAIGAQDTLLEFLDSADFRASDIGRILEAHAQELSARRDAYRRRLASLSDADRPDPTHISLGACPFECCVFRDWSVLADTALVERPLGERVTGTVRAGGTVTAVTGRVYVEPVPLGVAHDFGTFKKGDALFLLDYLGEGYYGVFHRGEIVGVEFTDLSYCVRPSEACWAETLSPEVDPARRRHDWWVLIEARDGTTGWTRETRNFGNNNACG